MSTTVDRRVRKGRRTLAELEFIVCRETLVVDYYTGRLSQGGRGGEIERVPDRSVGEFIDVL